MSTTWWSRLNKKQEENHASESQLTEKDQRIQTQPNDDPTLNPGELTFEEYTAGGLGRHLGVTSCTLLIVGRIVGTSIFSTPSFILSSVGSVGASFMLWAFGFFFSLCGLFIWLEFGTMFPRSGGEKVYLEAVYTKPKYLATVVFAVYCILLGFTPTGCIVFASNILVAADQLVGRWNERGIALGVIFFVTLLHGLTPKTGVLIMNLLSIFKILILIFVVITGWVVLSGKTRVADPHYDFRNAFAGSSTSSSDYAAATFKILNAYAGWSNVNYVMNDVRNPVRTLKIAGLLGLGICAVLYLLANVAYFAAATKLQPRAVFGSAAERVLAVFIALSALGNVVTVTFAAARVNQEIAKEGIPLPFGNKFWASNWPTGKSPLPGLIIHLIPSESATAITIIAPPPNIAFPFILDIEGYPQQIVDFFIVTGLFYLRWKKPDAVRPFKVWWPFAVFFLVAAAFLLVAPFLRPPGGVGDTPPLPYYLYCLVGITIMFAGVLYWAVWRIILPKVFGYELVLRKEELDDGTVVAVFSNQKTQQSGD
ncbi:amino acid transporter [Suillus hirtellus]|nr:amino acid transporter [Suillus hirtellus]